VVRSRPTLWHIKMSDAIIGVLVGGLIGWVAPFLTLRYSERKWKLELLLAHLKSERERMEAMYERVISQFGEGMAKNAYPSNMSSDLLVLCPGDVRDIFTSFMSDKEKTEERCKVAYLELASAMKRDLRARDDEMRRLLGAP
jgi:gas vesicle protein